CYQGDVGLHVAKTIWAIHKKGTLPEDDKNITEKVKWLGEMYVYGSQFDDDIHIQKEIAVVNKKIFEKSDHEINTIYEVGRRWSLVYFETIYARLGTAFNEYFFESEVADDGIAIVKEFLGKGVFTESEGAIVFKGEDHGLHTRVFITSNNLPTYEAKELGLNTEKFTLFPDLFESVIITANEQNEYFKVILKVFSLINPTIFSKTRHISHGILRFATGKMSSRKGNIISADSLLSDIKTLVMERIADKDISAEEKDELADMVAIGAIKYTILRQSIGSDVIFDSSASISFEGDSGPYLQYSVVRAQSIIEKAKTDGIAELSKGTEVGPRYVASHLEKLISRFPQIVAHARNEYSPQHVANYLIALSGAFNSYYAANIIVDKNDAQSPYRVALTQAFITTMKNGLWLLGIKVPKRM
nr:arginine--tRNA ligase [bacterium]